MSQLITARRQANAIRTLIRQSKHLPAIQALRDTVLAVLKNPLMKAEREEFERLITDGAHYIMSDPIIRKSAALELKYVPGQERELLESLDIVLEAFQENMQKEAQETIRLSQEKKEQELARGQTMLDAQDVDGARGVFSALVKEAGNDGELMADIGQRFLKANQYQDAADYLGDALTITPNAAHIYNMLAMAKRKLGDYDEAEKNYLKAAQNGYKDSHLFFNMGRLYVDWQKWDKAVKAAQGALTLDPDFEEAKKMMSYAEKKMKG